MRKTAIHSRVSACEHQVRNRLYRNSLQCIFIDKMISVEQWPVTFPYQTIALDVIIVIIGLDTAVIAIIALCIHN